MTVTPPHPLLAVLEAAADGVFRAADGLVEVLPPDADGTRAIVEFTGHAFVLTTHSRTNAIFDRVDAFGGATQPTFVLDVAGPDAVIGSHDLVMVRRGGANVSALPVSASHDDHPRVRRARHHRRDLRVFGDERGLVTVGHGLADRTELSVELVSAGHGAGVGRSLILGGLANVAPETWVFAQVAPGNAASVRAFLACGFAPIGSEILIGPPAPPRETSDD